MPSIRLPLSFAVDAPHQPGRDAEIDRSQRRVTFVGHLHGRGQALSRELFFADDMPVGSRLQQQTCVLSSDGLLFQGFDRRPSYRPVAAIDRTSDNIGSHIVNFRLVAQFAGRVERTQMSP